MLTKKEQRLRRARQTRIRIFSKAWRVDCEPYQPPHLRQRDFWRRHQRCWQAPPPAEADVRQSLGGSGKGGNAAAAQLIGKRIAEKAKSSRRGKGCI